MGPTAALTFLVVIVFGACTFTVAMSAGFTVQEKQEIVDFHNKVRSHANPEAKHMPDLVWDDTLAYLAQEWAEKCNPPTLPPYKVHGMPADKRELFGRGHIGQNMHWGGRDGVKAIRSWRKEMFNYDICAGSNKCLPGKFCGHYKQIVWAKSTKVGCGVADCPKLDRSLIVCHYFPGGNLQGQTPYELRHPCGDCQDHFCGENGFLTTFRGRCWCRCKEHYRGRTCSRYDCRGAKDHPACGLISGLSPGSAMCDPSKGFALRQGGPKIPVVCPVTCGLC